MAGGNDFIVSEFSEADEVLSYWITPNPWTEEARTLGCSQTLWVDRLLALKCERRMKNVKARVNSLLTWMSALMPTPIEIFSTRELPFRPWLPLNEEILQTEGDQ